MLKISSKLSLVLVDLIIISRYSVHFTEEPGAKNLVLSFVDLIIYSQ